MREAGGGLPQLTASGGESAYFLDPLPYTKPTHPSNCVQSSTRRPLDTPDAAHGGSPRPAPDPASAARLQAHTAALHGPAQAHLFDLKMGLTLFNAALDSPVASPTNLPALAPSGEHGVMLTASGT